MLVYAETRHSFAGHCLDVLLLSLSSAKKCGTNHLHANLACGVFGLGTC